MSIMSNISSRRVEQFDLSQVFHQGRLFVEVILS